jgi:hypothetical protein
MLYTGGSEILTLLTHCHSKTRQRKHTMYASRVSDQSIPQMIVERAPCCFGEVIDTLSPAGEADETMGGHMGPRGLVMLRLGRSVGVHSNLHLLCLQIALPKSKSISPFAMTTNKSLIADWVGP